MQGRTAINIANKDIIDKYDESVFFIHYMPDTLKWIAAVYFLGEYGESKANQYAY
jgi:hypothetical protein